MNVEFNMNVEEERKTKPIASIEPKKIGTTSQLVNSSAFSAHFQVSRDAPRRVSTSR